MVEQKSTNSMSRSNNSDKDQLFIESIVDCDNNYRPYLERFLAFHGMQLDKFMTVETIFASNSTEKHSVFDDDDDDNYDCDDKKYVLFDNIVDGSDKILQILKCKQYELPYVEAYILTVAERLRCARHYDQCIYLLLLAKAYGFYNEKAQYNMLLAKSKASNAGEMAFSNISIKVMPEYYDLINNNNCISSYLKAQMIRIAKVQKVWKQILEEKSNIENQLSESQKEKLEKEY